MIECRPMLAAEDCDRGRVKTNQYVTAGWSLSILKLSFFFLTNAQPKKGYKQQLNLLQCLLFATHKILAKIRIIWPWQESACEPNSNQFTFFCFWRTFWLKCGLKQTHMRGCVRDTDIISPRPTGPSHRRSGSGQNHRIMLFLSDIRSLHFSFNWQRAAGHRVYLQITESRNERSAASSCVNMSRLKRDETGFRRAARVKWTLDNSKYFSNICKHWIGVPVAPKCEDSY